MLLKFSLPLMQSTEVAFRDHLSSSSPASPPHTLTTLSTSVHLTLLPGSSVESSSSVELRASSTPPRLSTSTDINGRVSMDTPSEWPAGTSSCSLGPRPTSNMGWFCLTPDVVAAFCSPIVCVSVLSGQSVVAERILSSHWTLLASSSPPSSSPSSWPGLVPLPVLSLLTRL